MRNILDCRQPGALLLLFVLMFFNCGTTPAVLATGQGDGSGGGQGQPLTLALSIPADGQKDVSPATEILLTFNKNVVHMTVCDNNRKCLALYAADGSQVPVEVVMADDQIEPEKKRDIQLKPLQNLEPATNYTVKISPELQSKSGVTVGQEILVSFTTTGVPPDNAGNGKAGGAEKSLPDSAASSPDRNPADSQDEKGDSVAGGGGAAALTSPDSTPEATLDAAAGNTGSKPSPAERPGVQPVTGAPPGQDFSGKDGPSGEKEAGAEAEAETGAEAEPAAGAPEDEGPAPVNKGFLLALGMIVVVAILAYRYIRKSATR